jgi:serine/threonine protein kinase
MSNIFKTGTGTFLDIGERIAKGGEGEVYEVSNIPGMLFKSYYAGMRSNERMNKLKYMCLNKPNDINSEKFRICWPLEIVYENGVFAGFLMQKAFESSITPYHLCQISIPDKFSNLWKKTYDRRTINGRISRLMLCTNIAAAISRVHSSGKYIIADLKPQNILVTGDGKVSLIDMDSVQISENNIILFRAPVSTPEYTPPEAKTILNSLIPIPESWDSFSLGVLIYEILCGIHPYAGTANPPYDNHSTIAEKIENNLTHLSTDKSRFKVLPPPHSNFDVFSLSLKSILKSIFQDVQNSNLRPSIKLIGDTLAKEVQLTLNQKEKLEYQNAIQNYHQAEKQIEKLNATVENQRIRIEDLVNNDLFSKEEIIKKKVERIDAWRAAFIITLFISLITIVIILGSNQNNTDSMNLKDQEIKRIKETINQLNSEKGEYIREVSGLRVKVVELESSNKHLKNELNSDKTMLIPPILISDIKYKSIKDNNSTIIEYGGRLTKQNLYFLIPKIDYYGVIPGNYNFYIKIIDPHGRISQGDSSPQGYSYKSSLTINYGKNSNEIGGWGNDQGSSYISGEYRYEIWHNNNRIFSSRFRVY